MAARAAPAIHAVQKRPQPRVGALGIGAQKCASSWIHAIAASHPEIAVADPKEVDFFSYYFDRGYRWYERHFEAAEPPAASGGPLYFENSPSYFHDPRAPQRARDYNPDLKIVLLLRDPVKRAFSNHLHEIIKGHIPPLSFEEGLANNPAYVEQGFYARHLGRWRAAFPAEQILVLCAEEIAAESAAAARQLFAFLDVDVAFGSAILHERRNASDRARLPALRGGLRAGGDWMRRRGLEPVLAQIKATAPVARILKANSIEVRDEVPPMQPETASALRQLFAADMAELRGLLGRESLPWETEQAGDPLAAGQI